MGEGSIPPYTTVYDDATVKLLSNDFSRAAGDCYLDHAGTTLYSDTQIRNITTALSRSLYANPHSIGTASSFTQDSIERMRYRILDHFHTSSDEYSVIFTSGATASMKILAETFVFNEDEGNNSTEHSHGRFVYVQDNHTSVLGMRDVILERGAAVNCLSHKAVFDIFNGSPSKHSELRSEKLNDSCKTNSLFAYSAQCNFSGLKYPLKWIEYAKNDVLSALYKKEATRWYVLLDAAGFVPTNDLDLSIYKPDFVCLSFYKMFGYPTGIGALLVKNSSAKVLRKVYYGGGTVDISLSSEMFHVKRQILHQRFEDGTLPFLSIISLAHGFDALSNISMNKISKHVFSLAKYLHHYLLTMHHGNGEPVVKLYSDTDYEDPSLQGGIVTFNLIRATGEYIGYMEVLNITSLFKIHLRTGCFCNPGACQRHLGLSNEEVLKNYDSGYICGGAADLIDGKPTGAVRVSFGYMSSIKDVETLLHVINDSFVEGRRIQRIPSWWSDYKSALQEKYKGQSVNNCIYHTKNCIKNGENKEYSQIESATHSLHDSKNLTKSYTMQSNAIKNKYGNATLERLFIYPIKSCAGYEIKGTWGLNSKGLEYDREWMVVTSMGACLTQKHHANLCLIKPVLYKDKNIMRLSYPGMPTIDVPLENTMQNVTKGIMCQSRVCGHKVEGTDCGLDISEWLSLALGRPNLRLIRQVSYENEKKDKQKPALSFSSQAQYLLINNSSVMWLAAQIQDTEIQKDTIIDRFRANIVVSSCQPFEETSWSHVSIGKNNFVVSGICTRCQMICIDQRTGLKTVEPLRTLAEKFQGKLKFGIYLVKENNEESVIRIGDSVKFMKQPI